MCGSLDRFIVAVTTMDIAIGEAADRLSAAAVTGAPCAPVRDLIGAHDVDAAYRVQEVLIAERLSAGARRVGRKIGLTSRAVQVQLGVDSPDFGTLLDDMEVHQDRPVDVGRLLQPRIEGEIAFVLGADLASDDPTLADVRQAVAEVRPALEIVDSRIAGWDITLADTVADNASSGLFVLGPTSVPLTAVDTAGVTLELFRGDELVSQGSGEACLGDPLLALQWLARTAFRYGVPLAAGEVVLSGALGPMVAVGPWDRFSARMAGLGEVRVEFTGDTRT